MKDKITYDPKAYEQVISFLNAVNSDLQSCESRLRSTVGSVAAQETLHVGMSGSFKTQGRSYSYTDVDSALSAVVSAVRSCGSTAGRLARNVQKASGILSDNERALVNMINHGTLDAVIAGFRPFGKVMDRLDTPLLEIMRRWMEDFKQYYKEIQKKRA